MPNDPVGAGLVTTVPLGRVLRTACRQIKAWREAGYPALWTSVNISVRQFQDQNLPEMVRQILSQIGLPGDSLRLEITESLVIRDMEHTIRVLGALKSQRTLYDEYLASWDAELARLFKYFDQSGLRDKSYILITSDHGEMFERGDQGHMSKMLYEPLMHVPLIVSRPKDQTRVDVNIPTSSVDLLPTIAHLTGNPIPSWTEGQLLPALGGIEDQTRSIYTMEAKTNAAFAPLTKFSFSLTKGHHRLTQYQYPNYQGFEFYDLSEDPEELNDLYASRPAAAIEMEKELTRKISDINAKK